MAYHIWCPLGGSCWSSSSSFIDQHCRVMLDGASVNVWFKRTIGISVQLVLQHPQLAINCMHLHMLVCNHCGHECINKHQAEQSSSEQQSNGSQDLIHTNQK